MVDNYPLPDAAFSPTVATPATPPTRSPAAAAAGPGPLGVGRRRPRQLHRPPVTRPPPRLPPAPNLSQPIPLLLPSPPNRLMPERTECLPNSRITPHVLRFTFDTLAVLTFSPAYTPHHPALRSRGCTGLNRIMPELPNPRITESRIPESGPFVRPLTLGYNLARLRPLLSGSYSQ
jgi:hypothetical protein